MLFHRAGASMTRCRGGACPSRRSTCARNRLPFRGTRHCRGGACPSRRRTYSPYKPPSKWQTLPICHCEEANGRRGNLGKAVAFSPMAFPRCDCVLRDCHVASLLAMTHQGSAAVDQCPPAVELPCTRRSLSAATDAIGRCVFIDTLHELEVPSRDCTPRVLPRASRSGRHVASLLAMTHQVVRRCTSALLPLNGSVQGGH